MVMGPTHAMSGAAIWLAAAAGGILPGLTGAPLPVVFAGAAVCAGSALLPDLDCPGSLSTKDGSTVVRAFGLAGEIVGHSLEKFSEAIYHATASKHDSDRTNGHRTFTHTLVFAVLLGSLVAIAGSLTIGFNAFDRDWIVGQVVALVTMWGCLHLALFGLAEKAIKRQRKRYGLLWVMILSGLVTAATVTQLPVEHGYPWLGLAVGFGSLIHCFGDAITIKGVPILWPIPLAGKRWREIGPPAFLRIRAGGVFEYVILLPALNLATVILVIALFPEGQAFLADLWGAAATKAAG